VTMREVSIEFCDDGPDKYDRRFYSLRWWSVAQRRSRSQVFRSAQWREHRELAKKGHN
jgi:hypothetical protein